MRFLVFVAALSGCCFQLPVNRPSPLPEDPSSTTGTPRWPDGALELGTVDVDQVDYAPIGATLELHHGPQGGYHSIARYRVRGQTSPNATFENRVRRARDGLLVSRGSRTMPVDSDAGVWVSEDVNMFLCPTAAGVNIVDEALVFEVTALEADGGLLGRASVTAKLQCEGCQGDCGG